MYRILFSINADEMAWLKNLVQIWGRAMSELLNRSQQLYREYFSENHE